MFRTNSQIKGKFYEFSMASNNRDLVVKELDIIEGVERSSLLLIDYHATSSWPSDLPVRLKEMHSHWYDPTDRCLYIRPIAFQDRLVYGVVEFRESAAYHIPRPTEKLTIRSNDQFVVLDNSNQVMNALIKFEVSRYIHILQESRGCIKFYLPRYGLSFRIVDNGSAVSVDMTEYKLSCSQQIAGLLPHFTDYLVLEPVRPESLLNWLVLIPDGNLDMMNGMPKVVVSSKYDDSIGYFKYQVHRLLKHLVHDSILSGLHLSAVYAAAGSLLPDIRLKMTGSEAALGILRQCLVNRPYSREESVKIETVFRLGWREPALVALCSKYIDFSKQLGFLYEYGAADHVITSSEYFNDARSASKLIAANDFHRNFRKELVDAEYTEIHGENTIIKPAILQDGSSIVRRRKLSDDFLTVKRNSCKFKSQYEKNVAFPMDAIDEVGVMEGEMYDELKSSYDLFLKTPVAARDPAFNYSQWLTSITDKLPETIHRNETSICLELSTTKAYSSEFAILVASNRAPIITRSDLLKIALDKNIAFKFNPFIEDIEQLHGAILRLLEWFVLEETLSRAREFLDGGDDKLFIQEVDNLHRDWDSAANVDWLVFEVEGRLQIRSKQYLVAKHLIDSPGSICQLNMGEGKTRVILPMLIMYHTRSKGRPIYVNLLRQILQEARDYLQRYLSFSQLHIVTLELPFQRDVALTGRRVRIMDSMLSLARRYRCFITVSPESRLSLMLNSIEVDYECRRKVKYGSLLKSFLLKMKAAVNIFDESDRLLSHIFQLVYTAGDVSPLSDLEARMVVVQALLKAVNGDPMKSILSSDGFAAIEERKHVGFSMGAFTSIRLYDANTEDLQSRRELFKRELLQVIIRYPVRELQWMQYTKHATVILSLVFDQDVDMHSRELFSDMQWAQLTCLRGFLGGGLFEYALSLRESVTFGIDERRKKRIAVPYQAADLPTEKSEYSNPDLTLFLTSIAYYAKGLSKDQLMDSFRLLLKSNPSEQEQRYESWIASIAIGLDASELKMIGSVGMIDLNHPVQLSLLHEKFRYNVEVINFWLEKDVFPRDTAQYDKRIVGSAFDVAVGDHSIGFSGTKDNHRLIPWQVKQNEPDIDSLIATDGMMLYKIVDNTLSHVTLGTSKQTCVELLDSILDLNADALIDTGALLVGISNEEAAKYLVDNSSFKHRGVYYFKDVWMVMDRETRLSTEASRSSITSRESLIIYDEARTRGVDLKSKRDAVAVVTLGPKLTKANFMQGVGRLRAFGNRQKIVIAMTKEIEREIIPFEGHDGCRHSSVLRWIMRNTVDYSTLGLITYSRNAIQFAKSSDDRQNSVLDEDWSLETLYSKGRRSEALVDIVKSASTDVSTHFKNRILDQVIRYGSEHMVSVSSNNDQCEREMQIEEEEQQEVEVERAPIVALNEDIWSYSLISNITRAAQLPITINSFADKLRSMNHLLSDAKWPLNLYGTSNYFNCIDNVKDVRLIDAMLVFSDCVVVLSDMESDGILGALHDRPNPSIGYVNLRDLEVVTGSPQMALGRINMANKHGLLTAMKLFNGDVNYGNALLSAEINRLCPKAVEKAVVEHVSKRGNSRFWKFSDLEEALDQMNY